MDKVLRPSSPSLAMFTDLITPSKRDNGVPDYVSRVLLHSVSAFLFETFLYGILLVLSIVAALLLLKSKSSSHWQWLLFAGAVMLVIATADIALGYYILFSHILKGNILIPFRLVHPKYILYVTNNVIADCLVIYRCYMIWGRDKRIIVLPVLALIASSVCGFLFQGATSPSLRRRAGVYVFMTFGLNFVITLLMAGRIWWMARKIRMTLGKDLARKYNYAAAIIIESGTVYSLYLFLDLILVKPQLDVGLVQIVAIVPTLILVQVGLGREIRTVEETVQIVRSGTQFGAQVHSEIRFSPGRASSDMSVQACE